MTVTRIQIAVAAFVAYLVAIVAANFAVQEWGLIWVPFGLAAPAGVYFAGLAWPARDLLQRSAGRAFGVATILLGAGLSWLISPTLAIASGVTFLVSETLDMAVYTPLQRRWFTPAVIVSGVVSAVIDSLLFLHLAHIPYGEALAGQVVGKLLIVVCVGGPAAALLRRRVAMGW